MTEGDTVGDAIVDYDTIDYFRGNELVADPYPYFDWLRAQCPVHRESEHGVYMVTGYDEAAAVYTDFPAGALLIRLRPPHVDNHPLPRPLEIPHVQRHQLRPPKRPGETYQH